MESGFVKFIFFLKNINTSIETFIVNIYQTVVSIIKVLILSKFNIKLPKSVSEECYVLGNGPSLKYILQSRKEFLSHYDLFCVNNFPSTDAYGELKPKNLVFLDNAFFANPEKRIPVVQKTITDLTAKTNWNLNLYVPSFAKNSPRFLNEVTKNSHIQIYFFNYTIVKGFSTVNFLLFRKNLGMPLCQNVLAASLYLTINLGYKKISVLGADHSWMKDTVVGEDNILYHQHNHFYSNTDKPVVTKLENPFGKGKLTMSDFLLSCKKAFDTYYILEEYSRTMRSKILNATEGSFIDAFERKKI